MEILTNSLQVADYMRLHESAGWGKAEADIVAVALTNSYATFAVIEQKQVIGMARLLGDGAVTFYLKDFVILPEYQGQGVGKELLQYVQNYIKNEIKPGWPTTLELISAKGKEGFYQKFGFQKMPYDNFGAGMLKKF